MYKPYHLIGLELNISVLSAALRGEPTGQAFGFRGDVDAGNDTVKTRKTMEDAFAAQHSCATPRPNHDALDLLPPFGHPDADPKLLNFGRNETSASGADKSGDKIAIPRRGHDTTGGTRNGTS